MRLKAFNNGYCKANKKYIDKKSKSQEVKFPATFYFLEISGLKILLDAGYSTKIPKSKNIIIKLYSKITKVNCIKDADEILRENNIAPEEINYIIISHFHPDHYGNLEKFKNAEIICSKNAFNLLSKSKFGKLKNLLFSELIPENLENKITLMESYNKTELFHTAEQEKIEFFDILNLNEIYGFYLEGHAQGHIGIYLKKLRKLIVFDAIWCKENLENAEPCKMLKKIVFSKEKEYYKSIDKIKAILEKLNDTNDQEIELIISHDGKYMRSPYVF